MYIWVYSNSIWRLDQLYYFTKDLQQLIYWWQVKREVHIYFIWQVKIAFAKFQLNRFPKHVGLS